MDRVGKLVGMAGEMDADAQGAIERSAVANSITMEMNEINPAIN